MVAAVSAVTGIAPNDLLDTDLDVFEAMIDVLNKRARDG